MGFGIADGRSALGPLGLPPCPPPRRCNWCKGDQDLFSRGGADAESHNHKQNKGQRRGAKPNRRLTAGFRRLLLPRALAPPEAGTSMRRLHPLPAFHADRGENEVPARGGWVLSPRRRGDNTTPPFHRLSSSSEMGMGDPNGGSTNQKKVEKPARFSPDPIALPHARRTSRVNDIIHAPQTSIEPVLCLPKTGP